MHEDALIIIACEQAIRRFALYNDRHDHAGLAALFTDDGVFARPVHRMRPCVGARPSCSRFASVRRAPRAT